jgi:flagellar basal body-associated protein FliL
MSLSPAKVAEVYRKHSRESPFSASKRKRVEDEELDVSKELINALVLDPVVVQDQQTSPIRFRWSVLVVLLVVILLGLGASVLYSTRQGTALEQHQHHPVVMTDDPVVYPPPITENSTSTGDDSHIVENDADQSQTESTDHPTVQVDVESNTRHEEDQEQESAVEEDVNSSSSSGVSLVWISVPLYIAVAAVLLSRYVPSSTSTPRSPAARSIITPRYNTRSHSKRTASSSGGGDRWRYKEIVENPAYDSTLIK